MTSQEKTWCGGRGDPDALAKSGFGQAVEQKVSVYAAASEIDEARIIAALQTHRARKAVCYGLRIRPEDLVSVGLSLDDGERGTTGIPSVDASHRDIVGSGAAFRELTVRLLASQLNGADRVRVLWEPPLMERVRNFELESPEGISANMRKKIRQLQGTGTGASTMPGKGEGEGPVA